MPHRPSRAREAARIALAAIRLFNGAAALFAPAALTRRLGADPDANPAALYAFRLFGVRTILLGADLLRRDEAVRADALRSAVVIHASDVVAAAMGGVRGQLAPRVSAMTVLISTVNTVLAIVARPGKG
ncbi:MAG: hypothetical protein QOJ59_253 [Thermomicrobiales bacterium]|jgi:hypothetical protein|nr:hypothetical protein [Thermomicrobiales bacterium]